MYKLLNGVLIASLLIAFSYPVVGEVTKLTIDSDSTWKCINFEQPGWTSEDYDDSWWEPAAQGSQWIETGRTIWYPGDIQPKTVYFRKSFEIDGSDILIGQLFTGLIHSGGNIELYVNDQRVGDTTSTYDDPQEFDVTPLLKPGMNVIAAKVSVESSSWALTGTIRYTKS